MWRPFAFNFATHAFENFVKKINRAESAPAKTRIEKIEKIKTTHSVNSISEEAEKRIEDYKNLKKRVKQQRELIKNKDTDIKKNYEIRLRLIKRIQDEDRERKKKDMIRIRTFSSSKASRSNQSTSNHNKKLRNGTKSPVQNKFTIFGLTAPDESGAKNNSNNFPNLRNSKTSNLKLNSTSNNLNSSYLYPTSLRKQLINIKNLKVTYPNTTNDLKLPKKSNLYDKYKLNKKAG
jgi:hypothetical protein